MQTERSMTYNQMIIEHPDNSTLKRLKAISLLNFLCNFKKILHNVLHIKRDPGVNH